MYFLSSIHRGPMDLYASAALTGLGYALSKEHDQLYETERDAPINPNEKPSYRNMYRSDILVNTNMEELSRGSRMWNKSQNPIESGIVPRPAYADQFADPNFNQPLDTGSFESLSGQVINTSEFKHNNMQKFIGMKEVEQFDDLDRGSARLEKATGRGATIQRKSEVPCFFEPTSGFAYVNGMPSTTDFLQDRTQIPRNRNNDFPIEKIHVGKGLGKGYTAEPSGGFQQAYSLDAVRPRTVDELRVATKPRVTYELPPQAPPGSQIGVSVDVSHIGEFGKNRPDKFYEQTEDMYLKTTGAIRKDKLRPIQEVKPTARVESHIQYEGNARNNTSEPGVGDKDGFKKDNIMIFNNSREITGGKSILNNLRSTVKAIVAPVLDLFKRTKHEYIVDAAREYGNMHAQIPSKATTYDPVNHMMRTTIRETTTPDTTITNLKGNNKSTLPNEDEAKTTVRETTKDEDYSRNIAAHKYTVTVYNTQEVARTTVRNTTPESGSTFGFMGGNSTHLHAGSYNVTDIDLKNNIKQYTSVEYEGIAGSKSDFRPKSEEAELNAEIDATRDSINEAAGHTPNGAGGFTSISPDKIIQEAKRLIKDDFAAREVPNQTKVWQATAQDIPSCAVTKQFDYLNGNKDRLDPSTLASLATNPYNLPINPVVL
jgi:hypothetical protein